MKIVLALVFCLVLKLAQGSAMQVSDVFGCMAPLQEIVTQGTMVAYKYNCIKTKRKGDIDLSFWLLINDTTSTDYTPDKCWTTTTQEIGCLTNTLLGKKWTVSLTNHALQTAEEKSQVQGIFDSFQNTRYVLKYDTDVKHVYDTTFWRTVDNGQFYQGFFNGVTLNEGSPTNYESFKNYVTGTGKRTGQCNSFNSMTIAEKTALDGLYNWMENRCNTLVSAKRNPQLGTYDGPSLFDVDTCVATEATCNDLSGMEREDPQIAYGGDDGQIAYGGDDGQIAYGGSGEAPSLLEIKDLEFAD